MNRLALVTSFATALATLVLAAAAAAAPPEFPHGAGVCISQVATDPSQVGAEHLGEVVRDAAGPGSPGSGMPDVINGARGDGPNGCGQPPGPHQTGP